MNQLETNRAIISRVDEQLSVLFAERFEAVREIAYYKMEQGLGVRDEKREAELIQRRKEQIPEELQPYFEQFYSGLLAASRAYQEDLIRMEAAKKPAE